jgi:ABC-2 type transport system ATP-binding protein
MIEKGNLIVDGQVGEVMKKARQRIVLQIQVKGDAAETDRAATLLEQHDLVDAVSVSPKAVIDVTLKAETDDYSDLPSALLDAKFKLKLFREEEVNLETAFMELTKGLVQ